MVKISVTSGALLRNIYGRQKAIKTKKMTENSRTSNGCRFTYMLGLATSFPGPFPWPTLKPGKRPWERGWKLGGKLE